MGDGDFRQALYNHFLVIGDGAANRIKIYKLLDAITAYLPPYIREDFLMDANIIIEVESALELLDGEDE